MSEMIQTQVIACAVRKYSLSIQALYATCLHPPPYNGFQIPMIVDILSHYLSISAHLSSIVAIVIHTLFLFILHNYVIRSKNYRLNIKYDESSNADKETDDLFVDENQERNCFLVLSFYWSLRIEIRK